MKKTFLILFTTAFLAGSAFGYDAEFAQQLGRFYQPFEGTSCAKQLQMIPPKKFVEEIRAGKKMFLLDVRTNAEAGILGVTLPNTLQVPMGKVFTPEILAKLPTGGKVIVICKGGHRATAVAMGLRQIGFEKVYILKGGLAALANYLNPKVAN